MNGTSVERLAAVLMVAAAVGCGGDGRGAATPPPPANMPAWQGGYRLPVHGKWKVHRTHYRNKRDQSSGVDLVKLGRVTDKKRNEGFPSYGQPIVADAPGIVAIAVDGIPDNTPGVVNKYDQHGNYVVLDHRNGEFSLFAHFIPGSVRVRAGQAVAMGEELGKCGNSGASTMPHLHWQVMDSWLAHTAKGTPIRLLPYLNNGEQTTTTLQRGAKVEAIEPR